MRSEFKEMSMSSNQFLKDVKSFFKKITGKNVVAVVVTDQNKLRTFHKASDVEAYTALQNGSSCEHQTVWFKQDSDELVTLLKKALGNKLFAVLCSEKESDEQLPNSFILNVAETALAIGEVISSIKKEGSPYYYKGFISLNTCQAIPVASA